MRFLASILLGQAALVAAQAACNNNCGRAVAGTARKDPPLSARSSMCVAFLSVTVTPATSTVTAYETITPVTLTATTTDATVTETTTFTTVTQIQTNTVSIVTRYTAAGGLTVRDVTVSQTSIPAYATPCTDAAAYRSACSCAFSLTASTTTVATPTTTTILTVTATATNTEFRTSTAVVSVPATVQSAVDVTATTTLPCPSPSVVVDGGAACEGIPAFARACPNGDAEPQCNGVQTGCSGGCFCSKTDFGYYCVNGGSCGSTRCTTSSQCGPNELCDIKNCCGYGICQAAASCGNPALRFARGEVPPSGRIGWSH